MLPQCETNIYDSCAIFAPDGQILCRCKRKKAQWYVDRHLGKVISEEPYQVQLNFEPKGKGSSRDRATLSKKDNVCVVCGSHEKLTRHHVVPYFFRKMFPHEMKSHSSHDILPLCVFHHEECEGFMDKFKKDLAVEWGWVVPVKQKVEKNKLASLAFVLRNHPEVPEERKKEILEQMSSLLGRVPTEEDIVSLLPNVKKVVAPKDVDYKNFMQSKVSSMSYAEINEFCVRWRKLFLEQMKPQFMIPHWNVEYDLIDKIS